MTTPSSQFRGRFAARAAFALALAATTASVSAQDASPGVAPAPAAAPAPDPAAQPVPAAPAAQPAADAAPAAEPAPEPAPVAAELAPPPAAEPAPAPAAEPTPIILPSPPVQPAPAPGIGLLPSGSFMTRYELRSNYGNYALGVLPPQSDDDAVKYRARLGLTTTPIQVADDLNVSVRFVPQAAGLWSIGADTIEDPTLGMHEGLIQVAGDNYRFDAGRFEMNYGDAFLIGNLDWNPIARAFDGLRLHLADGPKGMWIDTFFTVVKEGNLPVPAGVDATGAPLPALPKGYTEPFATDDVYFGGAYVGLGPQFKTGFELDIYGLVKVATVSHDAARNPIDEASTRVTVGSRVKHKAGLVDYRIEVGVQAGSQPNDVGIFAYQGDAEIGFNFLDDTLRVAGEGLYASGDDPATADKNEGWDHLYPTGHKWLGFTDIIGQRSNIGSGVLHASYVLASDWKLSTDLHFFVRPEDSAIAQSGYAGTELDTGLAYKLGKGLSTRAAYDIFVPEKDYYGSKKAAHFVEAELRFDF